MSSETDPQETAKKAFSSPTALTARMKTTRSRNTSFDEGPVASKSQYERAESASIKQQSQKRSDRLGKTPPRHPSESRDPMSSPSGAGTVAGKLKGSTLRDLADVAGLSLHDTPPRGSVSPSVRRSTKNANPPDIARAASSMSVDSDLVSAIEQLVDSKQAGTPNSVTSTSDVSALTQQIEQLAASRRAAIKRTTEKLSTAPTKKQASVAGPSPKAAVQAKSTKAPDPPVMTRAAPKLDLEHNDNAFDVIADLVIGHFENGTPLSAEQEAQLDHAVPPHVRESFVGAVRYRLEKNCPPKSMKHIHVVTRKCQSLGFDRPGDSNPLLARPKRSSGGDDRSATNRVMELNERSSPTKRKQHVIKGTGLAMPASVQPGSDVKVSTTESLARQQLVSELREASSFMADSKTKEAANFWRNHVLELQARLRTLHGEPPSGSTATDEDIMEANRRILGEDDPFTESRNRRRGFRRGPSSKSSGIAASLSSNSAEYTSYQSGSGSSRTDSSESATWLDEAQNALVKYGVLDLASLEKLYELIDLLIALLDLDKLLDFIDVDKFAERFDLKKLQEKFHPEKMRAFLEKRGYGNFTGRSMEDLEGSLDPEQYQKLSKEMMDPRNLPQLIDPSGFKDIFKPDELREAMNFDKIRDLLPGNNLRDYFEAQGLAKVWNLDKLRELMDTNKLREALERDNIREVLRSQSVRDFMGSTYRAQMSTVDVIAPSTLPAGYRFEAEIDGHRFLATVPDGGVRKGETFSCTMKDIDTVYSPDIPVGGWRDRLSDCCVHGSCHPVIWTTLFCPLLALGQIMTRMKFNFLGRRQASERSPFAVMASILIMWLILNAAIFGAFNYKWSKRIELSVADWCALGLVNVVMLVFAVYATSATRASLREKYMIREHRCYDLEDCCCSTFCMHLTIGQMARHTADYTRYEAACCSETGLEEGAELPSTGSDKSATNYFCAENFV